MHVALLGYLYGEGGIQSHTHALARGLAARGHAVRALTPPPIARHPGVLIPAEGYRTVVHGGPRHALRGFGLRGWADAIVVTGTGWTSMVGALRAGPRCRKIFFEVMSGKPAGRLDPRRLVHLGFDAVVGQGRPVEARFRHEFRWTGPSTTIPALPEEIPLPAVVARPPAGDLTLRMAYFGRLARHKNVDFLVRNWDAVEGPATLDIWGGGDQAEPLRDLIVARGLSDRIALRGRYPGGADYCALLADYDLTLLPTVGEEGAPLVLLESMACGVPFVANGVGGIPDYANADCAVTAQGIGEFLPRLREMVDRLRRQGTDRPRLQAHYRTHFSPSVLTDRWEAFLQEAACP